MRRLIGLVLGVVAGCASPTGDHEYRLTIREETEPVETAATVTGTLGGIDIEGGFNIGCTEGRTRGELQRSGARELVLVLHAEWPETCEPGITYYSYDATVFGLDAGSWHVQVLYTSNSENAPPITVFHDFVNVQ